MRQWIKAERSTKTLWNAREIKGEQSPLPLRCAVSSRINYRVNPRWRKGALPERDGGARSTRL
ncbi:hypothetical protein HMPREF9440_00389 [Sutterella parvirubra YIT 11816]|uniref:Uncharacterized protein n=1 Tax=Sutterella parvirubra YIT 11816 TaxID=762967 RepID=H3KCD7_9BURK|nr:hypothetical protein HMPREF9440_00389 [Sutterella parvirubra YIT 11816]